MMRVVITGAGTINPLGADVATTLRAMAAGVTAISDLSLRDQDRLTVKIGAMVRDFDSEAHFPPERLRFLDRFSQFALIAARQAVAQSGLNLGGPLASRTGVIIGSAGGGLTTSDDNFRAVYQEGRPRAHPFTVPRLMGNAAASQISIDYGLQGPTFAVSSACASSNHAIGLAFQMVRSGLAPVMLAGGAEAMLTFGGLKAWEGLRVMAPDACRPFSADRTGMVMGEGAGVFVLEARDHALARGAMILAE
ncbi:MAG: beta-ketoacyl-[acyl-carrier-protein] synthase family protein, partial [Rhodobacteraceae bacterium]|nr:beta-ketoacyl-[acyl-carrier-protein] synthase family protein [Paracoccaceae bacterium]